MKFNNYSKWIKMFILGVSIIAVYFIFQNIGEIFYEIKRLLSILSPFIIGLIIAYVLYFPVSRIEKWLKLSRFEFFQKHARPVSVLGVYAFIFFLFSVILIILIPQFTNVINDMIEQFPTYINSAVNFIHDINEDVNIPFTVDLERLIQSFSISDFLKSFNIASSISGILSISSSVLNIFLSVVSSIYILVGRKSLQKIGVKLLSLIIKEQQLVFILKYLNKTHEYFSKFISCQIIDSCIIGVIATLGMTIIGVPFALVLGPIIGLSNMIPYFGSIVSSLGVILITIFTGGIGKAVTTGIFLIIAQQLDGNFIQPKILGTSMKLEPLLVIIGITIGGAYLNVLGMIIAIPVIALLRSIVWDIFEYKEKKILERENQV